MLNLFIDRLFRQKRSSASNDRVRDFDADWHFIRDSVAGAEQPGFDDSKWRVLDLPHDWSIEDLPEQIPGKTIGPFSKESEGASNGGFNRSCCWRHGMVSQNHLRLTQKIKTN